MLLAYKAALASPRIRAAAIEATEFPKLADSMDVWAVPRVVVDGVPQWDGAVPERVFFDRILAREFVPPRGLRKDRRTSVNAVRPKRSKK